MKACGIDPGNEGAIAFLDTEACTLDVYDMPLFEWETTRRRKKVDQYALAEMFATHDPIHAYVEEVWSSPQQGVVSAFSFGLGRGIIEGVLAAQGIAMTQPKPAKWKKEMRAPADKKASVQRASQLLPGASGAFRGPRGGTLDGRAEAALLALYGALELGHTPTQPVQLLSINGNPYEGSK